MREVGDALRKDPNSCGDPRRDGSLGVDVETVGIGLRGRLKVLPREKDTIRREFLKRLAARSRRGVKAP